jgi:hypothetical protein
MRNLVNTAFLLLIAFDSYSQADYAITLNGDTLRGRIKILTYDLLDRVQVVVEKKKSNILR